MQQQPPNFDTSQPQPKNEPLYQSPQQGEIWHPQPPTLQPIYPPPPYGQPSQQYPPQQPYPLPPYGQQPQQPMYPPPMYGQPQQYPQQQPYPLQPYPQMMPPQSMNVNNFVNVNVQQKSPGFLIRALYFMFIGWWAGYIWLNIGFFFCALIITLPLGLVMLNRLPQILTLRPQSQQTNVNVATSTTAGSITNIVNVNVSGARQNSMLLRIIYFLFIGCWVGYIWASIGYFFCVTILGLPLGLIMLNRLPAVLTLRNN